MYEYKATLIRILDGNTVEAQIDLGFNISLRLRIRLYEVFASPRNKVSKQEFANECKKLASNIPNTFIVKTIMPNKQSKAGRVFGIIYDIDENGNYININDKLKE